VTAFVAAGLAVVGFILLIKLLRLVEMSVTVIDIAKQALADLRDLELHDDDKEAALQRHALRLFGLFFLLTLGGAAAFLTPIAVLWGLERVGILSLDAVVEAALTWQFLTASTVLTIAFFWLARKR
jgi:hypothetical protein